MNVSIAEVEATTNAVYYADPTGQTCYAQLVAVKRGYENACKDADRERVVRSQAKARAEMLEHQLQSLRQSVVRLLVELLEQVAKHSAGQRFVHSGFDRRRCGCIHGRTSRLSPTTTPVSARMQTLTFGSSRTSTMWTRTEANRQLWTSSQECETILETQNPA